MPTLKRITLKSTSQAQREANKRGRSGADYDFYHSTPWRKVRKRFIDAHPACSQCRRQGKLKAAQVVDHIIPLRLGGAALDEANLDSLCHACHSRKSRSERGKS